MSCSVHLPALNSRLRGILIDMVFVVMTVENVVVDDVGFVVGLVVYVVVLLLLDLVLVMSFVVVVR
jgi:hypothetical protein